MKSLTHEIQELVNKTIKTNDKEFDLYSSAINEFNEMVSEGLIKPRGNNLISIQDAHLYNTTPFNQHSNNGA